MLYIIFNIYTTLQVLYVYIMASSSVFGTPEYANKWISVSIFAISFLSLLGGFFPSSFFCPLPMCWFLFYHILYHIIL